MFPSRHFTLTGYVNIVNNGQSAFGKGWDILDVPRIYTTRGIGVPDGVLVSMGGGTAEWYERIGTSNDYTTPDGEFSTLVLAGSGWELTDKWGTKFIFAGAGGPTSRVWRTGETTTYTWSNDILTAITDHFGRQTSLGYSGGKLISVTDFAGRVSYVTQGADGITQVTAPDPDDLSGPLLPPVDSFSYGTGIASWTAPDGAVTQYGFDDYRRNNSVIYPSVGQHGSHCQPD